MSVQVCVLGSGSSGNATLVMTPALHVLIDAGFAPDEMAYRLDGTGASWESLDAILLTHTHGDHLKKSCLGACANHGIQFICHDSQEAQLVGGRYYKRLKQRGLVRTHDGMTPFEVTVAPASVPAGRDAGTAEAAGSFAAPCQSSARSDQTADCSLAPAAHAPMMRFQPIALSHDAPPTFGFRIEAAFESNGSQECRKLAYLADLGECHASIAQKVADVDLLALEFNHDVRLERNSGRHPRLIQRVLSPEGHLSNIQAAEVFARVLETCSNGGPRVLLQMHLSRECNRPELAYQAAQQVILLRGAQTQVYSTRQDRRGTIHEI
jgi:phosphoribosyl 1,2-cyclic phosphodiesterase